MENNLGLVLAGVVLGVVIGGFLFMCFVPPPSAVCASAFGMKQEDVTWHDNMCWKKNSDTPLESAHP